MKRIVHFPGLNGIRFFAALLVVVDHTEELKRYFGTRSFWSEEVSARLGATGVTIFFALSGFLITYLLLFERSVSKTIEIRHFYVRRVLRIWPIYYLLVALGFFVFPHIHFLQIPDYSPDITAPFGARLALFVCLLPNVAFVLLPSVPYANVLWSVGVEEQFYLIWPWLVRRLKHPVIVGLVVFFAVRAISLVLHDKSLATLLERTRFSCMLIGAGSAYVSFYRRVLLERYAFSIATQVVAWLALFVMVVRPPAIPYPFSVIKHEVVAALATLIIVNVAQNPKTLIGLQNRLLEYLGKLSYGIYVFHLVAVTTMLRVFAQFYADAGPRFIAWGVAVEVAALCGSVVLAAISYRFFESRFLRMKLQFSTLVSGDLAVEAPPESAVERRRPRA